MIDIWPFDDHRSITEGEVNKLEKLLFAQLPDDYRAFLLKYNGGHPKQKVFLGGNESVNHFLGYLQQDACVWAHHEMMKSVIPNTVICIAADPFGNFVCLDLADENRGKVYFWDHEAGNVDDLAYVADSFTEFLESLTEREPLDELL